MHQTGAGMPTDPTLSEHNWSETQTKEAPVARTVVRAVARHCHDGIDLLPDRTNQAMANATPIGPGVERRSTWRGEKWAPLTAATTAMIIIFDGPVAGIVGPSIILGLGLRGQNQAVLEHLMVGRDKVDLIEDEDGAGIVHREEGFETLYSKQSKTSWKRSKHMYA